MDVNAETMDSAFVNIHTIVSSTKLRDFQFRFLHRKIFTNYILKIWGKVDSDRCTFCLDEYETIEHLFFYCNITKAFWVKLASWYEAMTDTEINITNKCILLNTYNEHVSKTSILDTIVLMAKQYIYRCKIQDRHPNFYNFKDEMFYVCKMERRLACLNNRKKAFCKKWSLFLK